MPVAVVYYNASFRVYLNTWTEPKKDRTNYVSTGLLMSLTTSSSTSLPIVEALLRLAMLRRRPDMPAAPLQIHDASQGYL